jgi:hypothetical protein
LEAASHSHDHHEMPTSGTALTSVALSATLHCLTGCAIGEVLGMVIGTALGFSDLGTIALAVALAFLFGYALTSLPLLRAGLALSAVISIALASDTLSIAVMEIVDNAIMLIVPGAMEAGVGDVLFWGALSVALVVAGMVALPVNRVLIARGKGHAVVHETGIHGGPPTRVVGAIALAAAIFGTTVLIADAGDEEAAHGGRESAETPPAHASTADPDRVRGLSASAGGMTLSLGNSELPGGRETELSFRILGSDDEPVRDFEIEHEKQMHLIVARRDLTGFQHLHPELGEGGTWRVPATISEPGDYRVFADFKRQGENHTLAADLRVPGAAEFHPLPAESDSARTDTGYEVRVEGASAAGRESVLRFTILKDGAPITVEPYLGAGGHLVALREGDLAYLHVHPTGSAGDPGPIAFATEFPNAARYGLFVQFRHEGEVHTAAFTRDVGQAESGRRDEGASGEGHGEH